MTWTNRVIWQEGMFLRAQHFQQQDRYLEYLVRGRTGALRPYPWGLVAATINRDLLATGRFALTSAAGVFEDGTPFAIPDETDHPAPLDLPDSARNVLVYLALPIRQAGAAEIASPEAPEARYKVNSFEVYDTHSGSPQPAELQVARLRLRYMLESEDRSGFLCIGLARVVEVAPDRRVTLDDRWIPPALVCAATTPLAGLITELAGILNQRGEELAARLTAAPGTRGVADVSEFLWLQSLNRWQNLLFHWAAAANVHPEDLYSVLVQMAGEFATFAAETKRPSSYPAYRHDDLQRSFAPVVADVRKYLASGAVPNAIPIPLVEGRGGARRGLITFERSLLRTASFVLTVQADMPAQDLQRRFPSHVTIAAVEQMKDFVTSALPGIPVRVLPVAPRQIPFYGGASYFELERNSPHWQAMHNSAAFGIFVSGDFPNLRLELWAIKGS